MNYISSTTSAEAPPPPLQTPPTPYLPPFCFRTCKNRNLNEPRNVKITYFSLANQYCVLWPQRLIASGQALRELLLGNLFKQSSINTLSIQWKWWRTPKSVTKIRAPLHPRGCPNETAPPCTLTFSCRRGKRAWEIAENGMTWIERCARRDNKCHRNYILNCFLKNLTIHHCEY